jgi:hypothetical protein
VLDEGNNAYVSGIVIRIAHGLLSRLPAHADLFTTKSNHATFVHSGGKL